MDEESEEEEEEEEECSEGYALSSSGECEDLDECREGNGGCEETCVNKPGTYECKYNLHLPINLKSHCFLLETLISR